MINYWMVPRPKRRLNPVPDVLATFCETLLDQEWAGQTGKHISIEDALEKTGLKRVGERRDRLGGRGGGGGRTYKAWLLSLGLICIHEATKQIKLTMAGEAILSGHPPVDVIKNQLLKFQFPSPYALIKSSFINPRFKIRPFRFLLKLLSDSRIQYLTLDEIAKIIITEAENETEKCYEYIVGRIMEYREKGDSCLSADFLEKYKSSRGTVNPEHPYSHLTDVADTLKNWIEYTQLAIYEGSPKTLKILEDKQTEVNELLSKDIPFIGHPEQHELFQRKYGLDPKHVRDNRNFAKTKTITAQMILEKQIQRAYLSEAARTPIAKISADLVGRISESTGIEEKFVEETLQRIYPQGSVGAFMAEYYNMAFSGREEAVNFELATAEIFREVFGFESRHVGPIGLTPDVLIRSADGFQAVIDCKAYSRYNISNDHHNRMVQNYIGGLSNYSGYTESLAFFSYIAGGFGVKIDEQLNKITAATKVNGSAMSVNNIIKLCENHNQKKQYSHQEIKDIFSLNRRVILADL